MTKFLLVVLLLTGTTSCQVPPPSSSEKAPNAASQEGSITEVPQEEEPAPVTDQPAKERTSENVDECTAWATDQAREFLRQTGQSELTLMVEGAPRAPGVVATNRFSPGYELHYGAPLKDEAGQVWKMSWVGVISVDPVGGALYFNDDWGVNYPELKMFPLASRLTVPDSCRVEVEASCLDFANSLIAVSSKAVSCTLKSAVWAADNLPKGVLLGPSVQATIEAVLQCGEAEGWAALNSTVRKLAAACGDVRWRTESGGASRAEVERGLEKARTAPFFQSE